ncbi:MAG: Lrp/AsnC family transcriptional regulator [Methanobacteriota archaeon]
MRKPPLTKKEQLGLYYLVRYPDYNDREQAEATGLKLSTVTAIRRRLKRRGFYYSVVVPKLQMMGYEMLAIGYGRLKDPGEHVDTDKLLKRFSLLNKAFYMCSDPNSEITLNMAENYTDIRRDIEDFQQYFAYHDMLEESRWNTVIFPYRLTSTVNYFDLSKIVQRAFNLNVKPLAEEIVPDRTDASRLSAKEKKVFRTMVTNPEMADSVVAERAGVSRQAVSAMKKRFLKDGLIENKRMLNLHALGYQIVSFVHQKIKVGVPEKERLRLLKKISSEMPSFFFVTGATEFVMMTAHRDFQDYTESMTQFSTMVKSSGFSLENPTRLILSVPGMTDVRKHDYGPILEQLLEKSE